MLSWSRGCCDNRPALGRTTDMGCTYLGPYETCLVRLLSTKSVI
jgi:hypothetical protein